MDIELKTVTLDGKKLAYTSETLFLVQVGKNRSAYRTKWSFTGNIHQAVAYYRGLNVAYGYKKRLYVPSFNKPTLAKLIT